jgi:hypothetical protein
MVQQLKALADLRERFEYRRLCPGLTIFFLGTLSVLCAGKRTSPGLAEA